MISPLLRITWAELRHMTMQGYVFDVRMLDIHGDPSKEPQDWVEYVRELQRRVTEEVAT